MQILQWSVSRLFAATFFLGATLSGCGQSDSLNRQAVSGEVTLNGAPILDGTIEFSPLGPGTSSGAVLKLGTFAIPAEKGLPPGEYVVRISAADVKIEAVAMPGESNVLSAELIPPQYNSESDVHFTVKPDQPNVFNLDVQS